MRGGTGTATQRELSSSAGEPGLAHTGWFVSIGTLLTELADPIDVSAASRAGLSLNPEQQQAVRHGAAETDCCPPLLVLAGAGTGKTATLAHRVAWLIEQGVPPERVLLLTFSRRAASEMIHRAGALLVGPGAGQRFHLPWAGTFHSVAALLLRRYASLIGLNPNFTILDRSDSIDLFDWLRESYAEQAGKKRFPRAATCLSIYSDVTNTGASLEVVLEQRYPWCKNWLTDLQSLMAAYVTRKQAQALLDFDDLLLWWRYGLEEPGFADRVRCLFDHILVDEYQDSNRLQVELLSGLKPDGRGLFVVGDDAQSIYSFRGAEVDHLYRFSAQFSPPASRVALQRNYRSTQAILDTANCLIAGAHGPYDKTLVAADQRRGASPRLVTVLDDAEQSMYLVERILERREQGIALKQQAVLFRNSHHSDGLEIELARRNIPFVKYGGLKFVESAHIRDALALLRWAINPRDGLAGFRVLQLLAGVGPVLARSCLDTFSADADSCASKTLFSRLKRQMPRGVADEDWTGLCDLLEQLSEPHGRLTAQVAALAEWMSVSIAGRYDQPEARQADIRMLESISAQFPDMSQFIHALALDPPNATGGWGDNASHDEDYLILSTVHSAKGQEWQSVSVINVADGNFPNEFSTSNDKALAEERRLLYVAMTRAREHLELIEPMRYYLTQQPRYGAAHVYGARSRFLDQSLLDTLDCHALAGAAQQQQADGAADRHDFQGSTSPETEAEVAEITTTNVAARIRSLWE